MSLQSNASVPRAVLGGLWLATCVVASSCVAGEDPVSEVATEAQGAPSAGGRPITAAEIAEITSHPNYRNMVEVLGEGGSALSLTSGSVFAYETNPNEVEILFQPRDAAGNPDRQYAEVVYQRVRGVEDPFYFTPYGAGGDTAQSVLGEEAEGCEGPAKALTPPQTTKEDDVEIAACGSWSSWYLLQTKCEARFWCFRKNQKGTYAYWQRQRQCSWGIQLSNRRDFVGCGC